MWGWNAFEGFRQDTRYGLRMMRRSPVATAAAILSLALAIGVNTSIFSLINTIMLQMLPVRDPGQLVELLTKYPGQAHFDAFSWQAYQYIRDRNDVFSGVIAGSYANQGWHVRSEGRPVEKVYGQYVSGNFFSVLGVKPAMGRLIRPEDDRLDSPANVAVISWGYWNSVFNRDAGIVGRRIFVDDTPVTIIGVTAREFFGLQVGLPQDICLPVAMEPLLHHPSWTRSARDKWLELVGRLRPGVPIAQARAEMAVLYRQTIEEEAKTNDDPSLGNWSIEVQPAGAGVSLLRDHFAKPLLALMAIVGLLLLIACSSVANMLLARASARRSEMAMRSSLGASRFRLVRQGLTESLLLSAFGGGFGLLLAYLCTRSLVHVIESGLLRIELEVRPDASVLLFTAAIGLLTTALFGLAPALRATQSASASSLRASGAISETKGQRFFGKSLVVVQVALSFSLLSAAILFARYLSNLEHIDLGFRRDHLLLFQLDPSGSGLNAERLIRTYQELLTRLEAIPGVRSATLSGITPVSGVGARASVTVEGYVARKGERRIIAEDWVAPKYFETLGIPLVAGRDFDAHDQNRSRVAVINQKMARYYFGHGNPIGKHVRFDRDQEAYEIVGVVGDSKYGDMRDSPRIIYLNAFQVWHGWSEFAVRTASEPSRVIADVRRTAREVLKTAPMEQVTTMSEHVDAFIVPERLMALLSELFGSLGALLAAVGLYGLLAYRVALRTKEIGIRKALGATRARITGMVVAEALSMVLAGLAIGVLLTFWGKKFAANLDSRFAGRSTRADCAGRVGDACDRVSCGVCADAQGSASGSDGSAAVRIELS